jgi:hypothetical protein
MSDRTLKFDSFPLPFWKSQAFVIWSCDSTQLSEWLEARWGLLWSKHDGWKGLSLAFKEVDEIEGKPTSIIVVRQWDHSVEDVALLAHECYHATRYLHELLDDSEWHGVEEDAARLMEQLMTDCLCALQGAKRNQSLPSTHITNGCSGM